MSTPITLRFAEVADAALLFEWQSHPDTRRFFFECASLVWEQHVAWLNKVINSADRVLLIGEQASEPFGVLRYDLKDQSAEVSVYLNPLATGRGLGTQLLKAGNLWIRKNFPELRKLQAKVKEGNDSSKRAFLKAGFGLEYAVYEAALEEKY